MIKKSDSIIDLTNYGLTENQSVIYQIWLQMGTRSVTALARFAGVQRVLCYNILQELCKLGLCSVVTIGHTGYYSMMEPKILWEKLQEKLSLFWTVLPSLELLVKQWWEGFKVQTYQWMESMKSLYDLVPYSKTNLKAFLWADHIDPWFRQYLYDIYLPKRLAKWLWSRAIVSQTDHNAYFANSEIVPQTEVLIVPDPLFDLSSEIILFDETKILIACMSSTEMSWLLIQSANLYTTLEQLFELLWRMYSATNTNKLITQW